MNFRKAVPMTKAYSDVLLFDMHEYTKCLPVCYSNKCTSFTASFDFLFVSEELTLPVLCISEKYVEIKINLNFYFHTSLGCLKRFYKGLLS